MVVENPHPDNGVDLSGGEKTIEKAAAGNATDLESGELCPLVPSHCDRSMHAKY